MHTFAIGFEAPTTPLVELLHRLDYVEYGIRLEGPGQLSFNRDPFNRWLSEYAAVPLMMVIVEDQDEPVYVDTSFRRIRVWICSKVVPLHTVAKVDALAELKDALTEKQKMGLERTKELLGCEQEATECYILYRRNNNEEVL